MTRFRLRVGSVLGIPISLHISWFVVFGLVTWATDSAFRDAFPEMAAAERLVAAGVTGLLFFACLLVHELAHSVVARRFGIPVLGITLFAFGGMAQIAAEVDEPADEFLMALVGPATSILIGGVLGLVSIVASGIATVGAVAQTLAWVNLGVGTFNLVPGLPLDGGRLMRAGLWRLLGDHGRATRLASVGGYVVALVLVCLGLAFVATGYLLGGWYVLVGLFLGALSRSSARAAKPPRALALPDGSWEAT